MSSAKPRVIAVEGLIGAGKSTLLQEVLVPELELSQQCRVIVIREPVEEWVASGMLQRFYGDQKRWAYTFQAKAFHDRVMEARRVLTQQAALPPAARADFILMERSPVSDQIFMRTLHAEGMVDDMEFALYQEWVQLWADLCALKVDLFVYVRTDVPLCMQRLNQRSRDGETRVTPEYQAHLLREHELQFASQRRPDGTPCICVDGTPDYRANASLRQQLVQLILDSVQSRVCA